MTEVEAPTLGRRAALVPLALVLPFLVFLARLILADQELSSLQRSLVLLAPPIVLFASIAGRRTAVALLALAPAALLYPWDDYFLPNVGGLVVGAFAGVLDVNRQPLRLEDLPSLGLVLCMLAVAILPPIAAVMRERRRTLFALCLAAYLPLLILVEPSCWRAVGHGAFAVAGGPLIRLSTLVALGWITNRRAC